MDGSPMYLEEMFLPKSAVEKSFGCAVDIGGSLCKIAYRAKTTSDIPKDQYKICFLTYKREHVKEAMQNILDNAVLDRKDGQPIIHTSGIGVRKGNDTIIRDMLQAKIENISEMVSLLSGFNYMAHNLPRDQVILPCNEEAMQKGREIAQQIQGLFMAAEAEKNKMADKKSQSEADSEKEAGDGDSPIREAGDSNKAADEKKEDEQTVIDWENLPYAEADRDLFPCLVSSIGTGCNFNIVQRDESFAFGEGVTLSGKCMMGLANLLVNTKDYNELLSLAEQGDDHNVCNYMTDLKSGDPNIKDIYEAFPDDMLIFNFGKAATGDRDSFRREDIARSLVRAITSNLLQLARLTAQSNGASRIFLSGGFMMHPIIQDMASYFTEMCKALNPMDKCPVQFYTLQHSMYVITLGLLVQNAKHYSKMATAADAAKS